MQALPCYFHYGEIFLAICHICLAYDIAIMYMRMSFVNFEWGEDFLLKSSVLSHVAIHVGQPNSYSFMWSMSLFSTLSEIKGK